MSAAKILNGALNEVGIFREMITMGKKLRCYGDQFQGSPVFSTALVLTAGELWDPISDESREVCDIIFSD